MKPRQTGMTLIEVVIATVIIAIAGSTIVGLLASMARHSADAMSQAQSTSIARAYLNEILARSFQCSGTPALRRDFDCVGRYHGLDEPPTDRFGTAIPNLSGYRVQVTVSPVALGPISAADARLIVVTVTDAFGGRTVLSGIKTDHP
jgi:prepilin-type N-terminal cleavage/methylation domain-containing protein